MSSLPAQPATSVGLWMVNIDPTTPHHTTPPSLFQADGSDMVWQVLAGAVTTFSERNVLIEFCTLSELAQGGDDRDGDDEMSIVMEEMSKWAHVCDFGAVFQPCGFCDVRVRWGQVPSLLVEPGAATARTIAP